MRYTLRSLSRSRIYALAAIFIIAYGSGGERSRLIKTKPRVTRHNGSLRSGNRSAASIRVPSSGARDPVQDVAHSLFRRSWCWFPRGYQPAVPRA
jgi:hypothetical protein